MPASVAAPRTITLPGQIDLADLVELVSKRLGVSVQYQRDALAKKVSLRLQGPVSDDELWRVLTAVLEGQGLVVVRSEQPGLYRIVTVQAAAQENQHVAIPAPAAAGGPGNHAPDQADRSSYISEVLRLRSASADEVAKAVAPLLTPTTGVAKPVGDAGLILLSDVKRRVEQAEAVIALLDGPADPVTSFVVEFKALTASEAGKLLDSVAAAQTAAVPRKAKATGVPPAGVSSGAPQTTKVIPLAGDRRALVVCARSSENDVRRLLTELDQREPRETSSYSVQGATPEELATSIRQLLDIERPTGGVGGQGPGGAVSVDAPRVMADKLTGSVLVTAPPRDHAKVRALVERLNAMPAASRQALKALVIKNRDASDLSQTLRELLGSGGVAVDVVTRDDSGANGPGGSDHSVSPTAGAAGTADASGISTSGVVPVNPASIAPAPINPAPISPAPAPSGAGTAQRTPSGRSTTNGTGAATAPGRPGLSITVDKPTNTIIAVGEPSLLAQLETLVASLDKRQPQVVLDVSLLTLNDSDALSFGVELQRQFQEGKTTVDLSSLFGLATTGALDAGTGFTGTVIRIGDYQAVVRALETLNYGRSVSMPKVLVNNNAKSSVKSVQRQPFTSINASTTVATTSFGGTQDAGTTVTVKPQITEGDHLILDYSVELSAFTGSPTTLQGGGIIPPPSQQNTVEGTVTLPDGYTVVVGGLKNTSTGKSTARVPLLGAIPLLGALFGTTTDSWSDSKFFVFIRATIVRDPAFEDLKSLQAADLQSTGTETGVPTLQPLWVE